MVARYQVLDHIGTTAGSHLYRARRLEDDTPVILKQFDSDNVSTGHLARFRGEYLLLQSLDIVGIAKPTALINEHGCLAMVLDNFAGESLESVLDRGLRMDLSTCLNIASRLAHVLADMHATQVIHQDIRPANLLVELESHQVFLADFSIATLQDQTFSSNGLTARSCDLAYISPEQTGRMNRVVDYRTDFYSFGITLYRMLTGQLPFSADDPLEWTHCHIARIPRPPREVAPEVPQSVSDIAMKLLAKLPEDRYQSMRGVQLDLDRCLAQWQSCGSIAPFPLGAEDFSERFQIPHKLYGREQEIATLLATFDRMAASGQAALVTVSGYSGIGKSALVGELHRPIVEKRGYFISGKFDQYQLDIPYATMTQAFRELVQQLLAESEASIIGWRQQIQEAVGANGQLIVDILPQLELIIGKQAPVPVLPSTEAQHRFRMVFRQFIAVFTKKEHPLTLFLDDLQWIDAASLTLIEHLLTHADTRYLLLIAAYRDNEVSMTHPLMASLDAIRHSDALVNEIKLAPLSVAQLNQLVANTLHVEAALCEPLTRLVFERTEGNPFFFTQFLDSLHKEGLLQWAAQERGWQWDLDKIKAKDFADNVVDLMVEKLRRLPVQAQEALQLAACLGNKFDLRSLALVGRNSEVDVGQNLLAAVREGLIIRTDGSCKFLHDRIQQAAYSLTPQEQHSEFHLRIGRALMASMTANEMSKHIFDMTNQLNLGAALLVDRLEKIEVARLNLHAGRKAKASAAYASACRYLAAGMALLEENDWESHYQLTFELWLERANCEFLASNFDTAMQFIAVLLQKGVSKTDQAAAYRLKIDMHVVKSENTQAVASALECLRLFGIDMSPHPSWKQVEAEYETVWRALKGRTIESLIDLPPMADPEMRTTVDVLSVLHPAAFYTDINLPYLLLCRIVNLSLQHGTTGASAHGYAFFGMHLGPIFHRYSEGYRFGKLACEMVEKHDFFVYRAKVYVAMQMTVLWTQPIATALDFIQKAFRSAIETGDLFTACYSWIHTLTDLLLRGTPLDAVWHESEQGLRFVQKVKFRDVADAIVSYQRLIANMQGRTATFSSFSDAQFDEALFEAQLTGDRMTSLFCRYWVLKLQARFLSGDYMAAFAAAQKAKALLWGLAGRIPLLNYFYYTALTLAALHEKAAPDEQREWRKVLAAHQGQLREWAENYPPTFYDKFALVSAEIARLEGDDLAAMHRYEQAIQSAHENGFVQNEAIAHELTAGFYLARGFPTAGRAHLEQARSCYARWGAEGKVKQLDERHPQLRAQTVRAAATPLDNVTNVTQLDLLAVAKASQAISGQIVLNELVDTLMRIVLENAGAQTGCLLLVRNEKLDLAADAGVNQQTVQVRLHFGQAQAHTPLPTSILNYVRRSREPVLLMDATEPHPFSTDPYFLQRRHKSVLCLPILRQSALIGLLYLENNLATHAFTPSRVKVLELLASQAAISLENAQLYTDLQQENIERKRAEEALREREARIRHLVESNIIGILFFDLQGGVSEANDAFLSMIGYRREDLLAGKIQWIHLTPAAYRALDEQKAAEVRSTGACTPYEKEFIRRDGSRIPVLIGSALFEGSQEQGVAFVLDLTERRQAEAERVARKNADTANAAKSTFLANMSHELRSPLNTLLGFAHLMERQPALPHEAKEDLAIILRSGEHLRMLINQVLDLARIEAGRTVLNEAGFDLHAMLEELEEMFAFKAQDQDLTLRFEQDNVPHFVRSDPLKLRQVLINLLGNALKFTRQGGVTVHIAHLAAPAGARLGFAVTDTGPGIAAEELQDIFTPFMQTSAGRQAQEGTGLGLSISRSFVRLMGGEMRIDSQLGKGTSISFDLPLQVVDAQAVAAPAERATRRVVALAPGQSRYRILVVDDRCEARQLLVRLLTPLGFDVREAANGQEAVDSWNAWQPHLIWMDMRMPVLDGRAATRLIKASPNGQATTIIALTASSFEEERSNILAAGCDDFLRKPFQEADLFALMQKHLGVRFVYQDDPAAVPSSSVPVDVAALAALPVTLRSTLKQALIQLDTVTVANAIGAVPDVPLAHALEMMANEFQYNRMLHLIQDVDRKEQT